MYTMVIADDEPYILKGLEKKLEWADADMQIVGRAGNGIECLETVNRLQPDILITDIRMPGLNGLELLERLQELENRPVVIFMSGYSEFEYARRAIELGALSYLLKPIGQKDLRNAMLRVRQEIERRNEERKIREERTKNGLLEFISTLPPGIERRIVMERLGMNGFHKGFLCFITGIATDVREFIQQFGDSAETARIPLDRQTVLYILNVIPEHENAVFRAINRVAGARSISAGVSTLSLHVADLPLLLRQAKTAYYQEYITGEVRTLRYADGSTAGLARMIKDFELMFSRGDEANLHRLIDQLPAICTSSSPSIDELLNFFNAFLNNANRFSLAGQTHGTMYPLISTPEHLIRVFPALRQIVERLHEIVNDVFGVSTGMAPTGDSAQDTVSAVKQYIRNNLESDLSADGISSLFGIEKTALTAQFKIEMGKTLTEFVRDARIEHACFLLQHTHLSIQEISRMCGYDDYYYFARLFRRVKGMTASDFRKTQGKPV